MHGKTNKTCTIQLDGDDRRKIFRMQFINLLTQKMRHTKSIFVTNNYLGQIILHYCC
jgi:hypothetical protein